MATHPDWIPQNHRLLYDQASLTYAHASTEPNRSRMGLAPDTPQGEWFDNTFVPAFFLFKDRFLAWLDPGTRTPVQTVAMRDARKKFVSVYRKFYMSFLKSSLLVTVEDLIAMNLPVRGKKRSHAAIPATWPVGAPDTSVRRRIRLAFADKEAKTSGKPHGVIGAEIRWQVYPRPEVVRLIDLTHASLCLRTPFILKFEEEERGYRFYYAMRWINTRGKKGSFGAIQDAIIP